VNNFQSVSRPFASLLRQGAGLLSKYKLYDARTAGVIFDANLYY